MSSLLDAHPHMIVADESYALRKWISNPDWKTVKSISKYEFFDTMIRNSVRSSLYGRRSRESKEGVTDLQLFGYSVPDQWQGAYERCIQVLHCLYSTPIDKRTIIQVCDLCKPCVPV